MAFRRTDESIPEARIFPTNLEQLGFQIADDGQVIDNDTGNHFFFNKYKKREENQAHYDAVHKAVRKEIYQKLARLDVQIRYLYHSNINDAPKIARDKPALPSVKILVSPRLSPHEPKEIYLVVGDSKQDLGVWSRQIVLTQGGIMKGSAFGLVNLLRGDLAVNKKGIDNEHLLPGIILLNPGELLYSHELQECMSNTSWIDRAPKNGFSGPYKITEHNKIKHHMTPEDHVQTFFKIYLPQVSSSAATALHIITIGDGSEGVLKCLNNIFEAGNGTTDLRNAVISLSMLQPTHDPAIVTSLVLEQILEDRSQAWEASPAPKGTLIRSNLNSIKKLADDVVSNASDVFQYQDLPVSCLTYSAGIEDTAEMIFPAVMKEVVDFTKEMSRRVEL